MDEIRILPMKKEDIPELARLEKICFSQPWSEKSLEEELDNHIAHFFTAIKGDRIIGYIGTFVVCESANISNIAVFPEYRRQGAARALITEACRNSLSLGAQSLSLEVRVSNSEAISLYSSMGFEEVGMRKGFYRAPAEDALILTKEL